MPNQASDARHIVGAFTIVNGRKIALHDLIMGTRPGQWVEHLNGDTLDNRTANLKLHTGEQPQPHAVSRKTVVSRVNRIPDLLSADGAKIQGDSRS